MHTIDIIFLVLVYKNGSDLNDLIESIKLNVTNSYKVLVVNSYYDEKSKNEVKKITIKNKCDFINVENKGYSAGNNKGIEYAIANYVYKYLVVCNPDTIVKSFINIENINYDVVAPKIITKNNKMQNPYWVIENDFSEKLLFYGYLKDCRILSYSGIIINKLIRLIYLFFNKNKNTTNIYAAHGCFILFSSKFLNEYRFRFDEDMFLFYEEAYLAFYTKHIGVRICYIPKISILHKEDGSITLTNINEYFYLKKSYLHYYSKYRLNK